MVLCFPWCKMLELQIASKLYSDCCRTDIADTLISIYLLFAEFVTSLPSATVVAERLCFHKHLSFCPQGVWGRCTPPLADTPPGQTPPPPRQTPPGRHPPETATAVDGTHPTRMHSCLHSRSL